MSPNNPTEGPVPPNNPVVVAGPPNREGKEGGKGVFDSYFFGGFGLIEPKRLP